MLRQFDLGRTIAAVGAAVLLVALFLPWYIDDLSGWESFETADMLLAAAALVTLAATVRRLPFHVMAAPAAAVLIVLVALVNPPPVFQGEGDLARDAGIWLALAASLAMLAGTVLATSRISVTVGVADRPESADAPPSRPAGDPPAQARDEFAAAAASRRDSDPTTVAPPQRGGSLLGDHAPAREPDATQPLPPAPPR